MWKKTTHKDMKIPLDILTMLVRNTCAYTRHYDQLIRLPHFTYNHPMLTMPKRHSAIKGTHVKYNQRHSVKNCSL